ncbi:amidase [soil metagenome]
MDLSTLTATQALEGLAAGDVSSVELLDAQLQRIQKHNPTINAVVATDLDGARQQAEQADNRRSYGQASGSLAGLPMTIKDTFETRGLTTTAGAPPLSDHVPQTDADVIHALRQAGAIIFGKTNVPLYAGDHQSFNDVYGITNNPWDTTRTPGGSSGGPAAALACGFTTAEIGSDIGNSIRLPAHFNGLFGLKPTHGVVSLRGHIPGPPGALGHPDLAVAGPLARSIDDLGLLLDVITTVAAFRGVPGAALPPSPGRPDVASLRVALWADDAAAPVSRVCRDAVEGVGTTLEEGGATIQPDLRPAVPTESLHQTYLQLLLPIMAAGLPADAWDGLVQAAGHTEAEAPSAVLMNAQMMTATHRAWLAADEQRHQARAAWDTLFDQVDVVVMPVAPTPAFPHNIELPYDQRTTDVDGQQRPYADILFWAGLATMPGLPSVAIPTGAVDGLPVGVQIMGPRYGDLTLLDIARTIAEATDATFTPPPGF